MKVILTFCTQQYFFKSPAFGSKNFDHVFDIIVLELVSVHTFHFQNDPNGCLGSRNMVTLVSFQSALKPWPKQDVRFAVRDEQVLRHVRLERGTLNQMTRGERES